MCGLQGGALETVSHLKFKGHSRKSKLYVVKTVNVFFFFFISASVDCAQRNESPVTVLFRQFKALKYHTISEISFCLTCGWRGQEKCLASKE